MPRTYKPLKKQTFSFGEYEIVPIRDEDKFKIMQWRNEQMYHLRQNEPLTQEKQEAYFKNVVAKLFEQEKPEQLLFSFLRNGECIGYGGLVHINWKEKTAELSFIMDTKLEAEEFEKNWLSFLYLIDKVAFGELEFNAIFTYAYDLRPHLYPVLEKAGFRFVKRLYKKIEVKNEKIDVIIHKKETPYKNTPVELLHNVSKSISPTKLDNVLVTSISKKVPLLQALRKSLDKINPRIKIYGGDCNNNIIGKYFVDEFWQMPLLRDLTLDILLDYCQKHHIGIIIPTRDGELEYFAKHKNKLRSYGIDVMVSEQDAVKTCLDKLEFARNQKLAIPTSTNIEDISASFYVVKERFGAGAQAIGIKLTRKEALQHAKNLKHPIFQPYIEGEEVSIDAYVSTNKKIKGLVMRKRILVINGESQITTTFNDPMLEKQFYRIFSSLNLSGHVLLQAFIDKQKNIHLIECNPRFGGASSLSIRAGLDSFYWFYLEHLGNPLKHYSFLRVSEEITQIRYPKDYYL